MGESLRAFERPQQPPTHEVMAADIKPLDHILRDAKEEIVVSNVGSASGRTITLESGEKFLIAGDIELDRIQ